MNEPSNPIIICKDIHKSYGEGATQTQALRGVNLSINKGELRMLMGPSGSGKTTLISIIAGILTQTSGSCLMNNLEINHLPDQQKTHYRGNHIGFVFQIYNLLPTLTTEENISIPLILNKVPRLEATERAKNLLKEIDLGDKIGSYPRDLSGGQQQRIAIARAIIHEPEVILCDEPTSALDHETGEKIMKLLKSLTIQKKITLIVVTHDSRIVQFADKIDYLEDGRIIVKKQN